jgi:putative glutamine amidotransferase
MIEAVEGMDKSFFVGIQCHPEALWQKVAPHWITLFTAFVQPCKK